MTISLSTNVAGNGNTPTPAARYPWARAGPSQPGGQLGRDRPQRPPRQTQFEHHGRVPVGPFACGKALRHRREHVWWRRIVPLSLDGLHGDYNLTDENVVQMPQTCK